MKPFATRSPAFGTTLVALLIGSIMVGLASFAPGRATAQSPLNPTPTPVIVVARTVYAYTLADANHPDANNPTLPRPLIVPDSSLIVPGQQTGMGKAVRWSGNANRATTASIADRTTTTIHTLTVRARSNKGMCLIPASPLDAERALVAYYVTTDPSNPALKTTHIVGKFKYTTMSERYGVYQSTNLAIPANTVLSFVGANLFQSSGGCSEKITLDWIGYN